MSDIKIGIGRARVTLGGRARGRMPNLASSMASMSILNSSSSVQLSTSLNITNNETTVNVSNTDNIRGRGGYRHYTRDLITKPKNITQTTSDKGIEIKLLSNYFKFLHPKDVIINQYYVNFEPNIELSRVRRGIIAQRKDLFGCQYIFDGQSDLKTLKKLDDNELTFTVKQETSGTEVTVNLKLNAEVPWGSNEMIRMYNTQMRRNLQHLGYVLLGRYFYDKNKQTKIPDYGGISIWTGFMTSIGTYEESLLMASDTIYKLVRQQTVLDTMRTIYKEKGSSGFKDESRKVFAGQIVMTSYNNKTYKIDDVSFDKTPMYTFERKHTLITLKEYYSEVYDIIIKDEKQPLLECLPSARDRRAGNNEKVLLIPELCLMTGLTDEMRANNKFCRTVSETTRLTPQRRVENLHKFMNELRENNTVHEEMSAWRLGFNSRLVDIKGRLLDCERILMNGDSPTDGCLFDQNKGDFGRELRSKKLREPVDINRWAILATQRDKSLVDDFCSAMVRVCEPMGIGLSKPKLCILENDRIPSFLNCLKSIPNGAEIVVCMVPNNNKDRYDAIKKLCCCDKAIASQVVVARTLMKKDNLMSVCTKIAIQMACKLGAEAWALHIPPKGVMVIGYDTYHDGALKGKSVGSFVSSLNQSLTRWFSKANYHNNREEMSGNFAANFKDSLQRYKQANGSLPERVIVYRDGVGDGMIQYIYESELKELKKSIDQLVSTNKSKLTFIIVSKKINTRFFRQVANDRYENPPPGTIIDTVVTKRERYDFFLISQSVRNGTVTPTYFNIIEDESLWKPFHHQQLAYKMTHLYYNWQGTIRVPAPCQYASKLAYLTGTSLHREPSIGLANTLFFL